MKKEAKKQPELKKISVIKSEPLFNDLLIIANFLEGASSSVDSEKFINWKISPLLKKIVEDFIEKYSQLEEKVHPINNNNEFIKFKKDYEVIKDTNQKNTTFDLPLKEHGELEKIAKDFDMMMSELIKSIFFSYTTNHKHELKAGKEILDKIKKETKIKKEVQR